MKRIALVLILAIASFTIHAQEEPIQVEIVKDSSYEFVDPFGKQELRLNMLDLLAGPALHVFYERVPSFIQLGFGCGSAGLQTNLHSAADGFACC